MQSFSSEGQIWGDITIETQYEQMSIPIQYKIAQGRLEIGPDRLVFDQCFPVSKNFEIFYFVHIFFSLGKNLFPPNKSTFIFS